MTERPLHLVALQPRVQVEDFLTAEAFEAKLEELSQAMLALLPKSREGDTLVVFPEYFASFLALTGQDALKGFDLHASTVEQAITRLVTRKLPALVRSMISGGTVNTNEAVFHLLTPHVHRLMVDYFSRFASRHHATVVAGSATLCPLKEDSLHLPEPEVQSAKFFNTSYVFSPHGQLVKVVRKVNMVPTQEDLMGVSPCAAEEQTPLQTPFGKLGVCICYDGFSVAHTRHEPGFVPLAQRLDEQGATVIAWPSANPWPWEERWVFGEPGENRLRKQQWKEEGLETGLKDLKNVAYVLNPHLVGKVLDATFDGQSSILAREGHKVKVLARSTAHDQQEVLAVTVTSPVG